MTESANPIGESLADLITPNVRFKGGFLINGETRPFYSFSQPANQAGWSNEMADSLEEASKNHFIDITNRRIVLEGLRPALSKSRASYIDFGASSGYMVEDVLAQFPEALVGGADYFSAGLVHCHERLPNIPLFQVDLTNVPWKDSLFDAISCLNVLEHIKDDRLALKQLHRILKPQGLLALTVPMGPHLFDLYDEVHLHHRRYTLSELREKVRSVGFRILRVNYFGFLLYPFFFLSKKLNRLKTSKLTLEEKRKRVFKQIATTSHLPIINTLCEWERLVGIKIPYPFGIRGYVIATKD